MIVLRETDLENVRRPLLRGSEVKAVTQRQGQGYLGTASQQREPQAIEPGAIQHGQSLERKVIWELGV